MLTNEQRAHDLAIAMLDAVKEGRISEAIENRDSDSTDVKVNFDYYREYKSLYDKILVLVNRDF